MQKSTKNNNKIFFKIKFMKIWTEKKEKQRKKWRRVRYADKIKQR